MVRPYNSLAVSELRIYSMAAACTINHNIEPAALLPTERRRRGIVGNTGTRERVQCDRGPGVGNNKCMAPRRGADYYSKSRRLSEAPYRDGGSTPGLGRGHEPLPRAGVSNYIASPTLPSPGADALKSVRTMLELSLLK